MTYLKTQGWAVFGAECPQMVDSVEKLPQPFGLATIDF
jgi:hypothetical protein